MSDLPGNRPYTVYIKIIITFVAIKAYFWNIGWFEIF
jgi:hypothetical protein